MLKSPAKMADTDILEGIVTGAFTSGLVVTLVKWGLRRRAKPGYKRVIQVVKDDGTILRYETSAEKIEDRPEVQKIVEWLQDVEAETADDGAIKSVSFTLEPLK